MKILITGGAGCLGSNLIENWLPQGHELFAIDNFATGKRELLSAIPGLQWQEGSVGDQDFVRDCFQRFRPQVVIHSAAAYQNPDDWHEDAATNILGSINVARAAEEYGAERVVNFQTNLCYGRPTEIPVKADHRLAPFSSYGISKTAGEQFMLLSKVPTLSIRISNVTGPRLSIGPIPTFYKRLLAKQSCFCSDTARDFLDISDFMAFMSLAIRPGAASGVFNVSSGESHTIKEIYLLVAQHLGLDVGEPQVVPPGSDDIPEMVLDPTETEKAFGWKANVSFSESIHKQLCWYDLHGITDVYSHLKPVQLA